MKGHDFQRALQKALGEAVVQEAVEGGAVATLASVAFSGALSPAQERPIL